MPAAGEIAAALAQTAALIEREPTDLVLRRRQPDQPDGAGGWIKREGMIDVAPQRVFLSAVTRDSDYRQSSFVQDTDGEKYVNHFIIVGMPDLNIQEYDEFTYLGMPFKVAFVHPEKRWQCKAEADRVVNGNG